MDAARRVALAATASLLLAAVPAHAAPGDLDPTFDGDGIVQAGPTSGDRLNALALSGDRIVGAGSAIDECRSGSIFRWLPDGRPDTTFGSGGHARTPFRCAPEFDSGAEANAVVTAPDGTVFTGGWALTRASQGLLTANDASGAPVASFGRNGYVHGGFTHSAISALLRMADGRLVGGGENYGAGRSRWELRRWLPDGSLDASFGDGGISHPPAGGPQSGIRALVADGDSGAMVGAGWRQPEDSSGQIVIGRIAPDGGIDPAFGLDGFTRIEGDELDTFDVDLARTSEGGFVVTAGSAIFRLDSAGDLDPAFGAGGRVDGLPLTVRAVAVDADDRVVVAGASPDGRFAVARFLANGALDVAFGDGGTAIVDLPAAVPTSYERGGPRDVLVQPDGRILVGGSSIAGGEAVMIVLRLLPDGREVARDETEGAIGGGGAAGGGGGTTGGQVESGRAESVQERRGRVSITILSSRVTRRGVLVRVTWPRGTDGRARARLWTRDKSVLLGQRTVAAPRGTTGRRFRIPLNRRAKRMLASGRRLRVRATVLVTGLPERR